MLSRFKSPHKASHGDMDFTDLRHSFCQDGSGGRVANGIRDDGPAQDVAHAQSTVQKRN